MVAFSLLSAAAAELRLTGSGSKNEDGYGLFSDLLATFLQLVSSA